MGVWNGDLQMVLHFDIFSRPCFVVFFFKKRNERNKSLPCWELTYPHHISVYLIFHDLPGILKTGYVRTRSLELREDISLHEITWANKNKPYYFSLCWLVNRDSCNGLLQSIYTWVVSPIQPNQPGFFVSMRPHDMNRRFFSFCVFRPRPGTFTPSNQHGWPAAKKKKNDKRGKAEKTLTNKTRMSRQMCECWGCWLTCFSWEKRCSFFFETLIS